MLVVARCSGLVGTLITPSTLFLRRTTWSSEHILQLHGGHQTAMPSISKDVGGVAVADANLKRKNALVEASAFHQLVHVEHLVSRGLFLCLRCDNFYS